MARRTQLGEENRVSTANSSKSNWWSKTAEFRGNLKTNIKKVPIETLLVVFAIIIVLFWFFQPLSWLLKEPIFLIDAPIMIYLLWCYANDKETFITNILLVLAFSGNIVYFTGLGESKSPEPVKTITEEKSKSSEKIEPRMRFDNYVEAQTKKILFAELPVSLASQLYFVIGQESTGYNQFDKSGNVIKNGTATCVAQIKTEWWGEKAKELDLDIAKTEDCLRMAVWIAKNDPRGINNWPTSLRKIEKARFVELDAPVGQWSENHSVQKGCSIATNNRSVLIKFENDEVVEALPGKYPELKGNWFWIQSKDENEPASLVLLCG